MKHSPLNVKYPNNHYTLIMDKLIISNKFKENWEASPKCRKCLKMKFPISKTLYRGRYRLCKLCYQIIVGHTPERVNRHIHRCNKSPVNTYDEWMIVKCNCQLEKALKEYIFYKILLPKRISKTPNEKAEDSTEHK